METLRLLVGQMELVVAISRHSPNDDVKTPDDSHTKKDCACKSNSPIFHFLAVLADFTKSFLVGAPLVPGFFIFSPEPSAMRLRLA